MDKAPDLRPDDFQETEWANTFEALTVCSWECMEVHGENSCPVVGDPCPMLFSGPGSRWRPLRQVVYAQPFVHSWLRILWDARKAS